LVVFIPRCNEFANKKKFVKIYHVSFYIISSLIEIIHYAVKDKNRAYYTNKFNKIFKLVAGNALILQLQENFN